MLVLFAAAIDCCDIITFFCVPKLVELFLTLTLALLVPSWPGIHSYFAYFMLSASGGLADTMALKCSQFVDFSRFYQVHMCATYEQKAVFLYMPGSFIVLSPIY